MTQTANIGGVIRTACIIAALSVQSAVAFAQRESHTEQEFANYSFAHELGSGVYETGGRMMQIYRLPFGWRYRETGSGAPGITLLLPVTLGFLDFNPAGIVHDGLPEGVDSLSFVPGIGLEFLRGTWRIMPFAKTGVAIADHADVGGTLYSVGVAGESLTQRESGWRTRQRSDFLYSGVNYRGSLPSDTFVRWRNGIEAAQGTGWQGGHHEIEGGVFAVLDWYVDPPTGPLTGIAIPALQFEAGVMLGTRPDLKWWRLPIPRIGLSYRFAGDVSGWRLVLGAPF